MSVAGAGLRKLLEAGFVVAPGAYDALSAKLAAQAGAQAVYMTGFGVSGSLLGEPDLGLVSAEEMAARVRALSAAAAAVPLIADGDNGHGGPLNAERLTRAYEAAGAACIQIEDQVFPKRCGHMEDKEIVPLRDAAAKIRAACEARASKHFLVMARTDARAVAGLDEALRRAEAFLKAGADILFVEAPQSLEEMRMIAERFAGVPLLANLVEDGKTPFLSPAELRALGYRLAIYPVSALLRAAENLRRTYEAVVRAGAPSTDDPRFTFSGYNEALGLSAMLARAKGYDGG
jgi:2,3-dimethylmalate lyase